MKKLKKMWNENRVLMVLAIVLLVCFVIILLVSLTYFYGSSDSESGDRLKDSEKYKITEKLKNNVISKSKENTNIEDVSINVSKMSKLIYIKITYAAGTSIEDAKTGAETVLTYFSDKYLKYYDFNVTITQSGTDDVPTYIVMGARNSGGSGIMVWNNNTTEKDTNE